MPRDLTPALLAAQHADETNPYLIALLSMFGGEPPVPFIIDSEDTYEPGTIVYVTHSEDPYSGEATVGIKRTDWWNGKNLAGYQIVIGYGYHTPPHEGA